MDAGAIVERGTHQELMHIPGGKYRQLYDELRESETILPLLVTHEGGAAFMADAVYRASGQVGVLMVVPAAGLTHAMSGIGEAYLDGIPMLVISGGVRTDLEQGFQLHEVDQQALMRTLTKATFKIESYDEAVATVYRAWRVAVEGEPGPVYIEIPANLQLLSAETGDIPAFDPEIPRPTLDSEAVQAAAELLAAAERPGIFVGWGAREVAGPVVFSILSNIVAFVPLMFIPGETGKFWGPLPAVVMIVLMLSLFEALFILPAHLAHARAAGRLCPINQNDRSRYPVFTCWSNTGNSN